MEIETCPYCKGTGKKIWNDGKEMDCSYCQGKGTSCKHEWKWIEKVGRCINIYQCKVCNRKNEVDSSD